MERKGIKDLLDLEVLQDRRGTGVPLEGLDPRASQDHQGVQGHLAMPQEGRKDLRDIKVIEALQVLKMEGQCTLAGDENPVPGCLVQRLSTKGMLLGPGTPALGEEQTCSVCQRTQSTPIHILDAVTAP